jgi:integrase/recombinase XerC
MDTATLTARYLASTQGVLAERTRLTYRTRLSLMVRAMPEHVEQIRGDHILRWLDTTRSAATRNAYLSTARVFFDWCWDRGHIASNPCRGIRKARIPGRAPRGLSAEAAAAVVATATQYGPGMARAASLMVQEGLRIGEVAAARWEDFDAVRGLLIVRGKGGRGEPTRVVPLSDQSRHALSSALLRGPIVPAPGGGHWNPNRLSVHFARIVREAIGGQAGDGRTAHALRHTAATDMVDGGATLRDVQAVLGHASIATTERYTAGAVQHLLKAIAGRWYGPKDAA